MNDLPLFILKVLICDLCTVVECKDSNVGERLLQKTANNIHEWFFQNGLKISLSKFTVIRFSELKIDISTIYSVLDTFTQTYPG